MNKIAFVCCLLFPIAIITKAPQNHFLKLTGPYLGQKPPGKTPEPFAPDILDFRCAYFHTSINFSPDSQEVYWSQDNTYRRANPNDPIIKGILVSKIDNGHWTTPEFASFSGLNISDDSPFISPDGKKLYFVTTRPIVKLGKSGGETIWVVHKSPDGWSEPRPLPPAINSVEGIHWGISVDTQGNVYFGAGYRPSPNGRLYLSIYRSMSEDGEYQIAEALDHAINKPGSHNFCPFISSDGSYLIFAREENKTRRLFISFRNKYDSWSEPIAIHRVIAMDEEHGQLAPYVSPDNNYLFFLDEAGDGINTNLDSRHYWVDASFIEELRKKELQGN
jgi:hypothetical protein